MKQLGTGAKVGLAVGMTGGIAGLAVAAAFAPIMATIFFFVFIPVFGFMIVKVIRPMLRQDKLLQTGELAEATILQIWNTNVTVNNKPQVGFRLEVRPGLGVPYEAEMRQVIPVIMLPQIQPGRVVAVRYDPNDRSSVVIDLGRQPVTSGSMDGRQAVGQTQPAGQITQNAQVQEAIRLLGEFNAQLNAAGTHSLAEITSLRQLAVDNSGVLTEFILQVRPVGADNYQAVARMVIPQLLTGNYYQGKILNVRCNPQNPDQVAIEEN